MSKKQNFTNYKLIQTLSNKGNKMTGLYKNNKLAKTNILLKKYILSKKIEDKIIEQEINKFKSLKLITININYFDIEQKKDQKLLIIQEENVTFQNISQFVSLNPLQISHFIAIAKTLNNLHQNQIIHGNIHFKNVFFDSFKQRILFNDVYYTFMNRSQKQICKNKKQKFKHFQNLTKQQDIKQLGILYKNMIKIQQQKSQIPKNNILESKQLQNLIQILCNQSLQKPTIDEIIDELGCIEFLHQLKPRNHKNVYLSLNLFPIQQKKQIRYLQCYKSFKKQISFTGLQFRLFKNQQQQKQQKQLILQIIITNKNNKIITINNFKYKQLNQQIKTFFNNINQLFKYLQTVNNSQIQIITSGRLIFKYQNQISQNIQENLIQNNQKQMKNIQNNKIKQIIKHKNNNNINSKNNQQQLKSNKQMLLKDNADDKNKQIRNNYISIKKQQVIIMPIKIKDKSQMSSDQQDYAIQKIYLKLPNYQKQINQMKKMLKIAIDLQNPPHETTFLLYQMMGRRYEEEKNLQVAKKCYKIALKGYLKDSDLINEKAVNLLNNLGILYCNLNQHLKGVALIQKSIKLAKQIGSNQSSLVLRYTNLGKIHLILQNFKESEKWLKLSLQYYKKIKTQQSKYNIMTLNINLSSIYIKLQEFQKSNHILSESIKNKLLLKRKQDIQLMYFNLGYGLIKVNKLQEGLKKYVQCFQSIIHRQQSHANLYEQMQQLIIASIQEKQTEFKKYYQNYKKWINTLKSFMADKNKKILDAIISSS